MMKTLKLYSIRAIYLIMFYYNSKSLLLKLLGVVVYFFIFIYVHVYFFVFKDNQRFFYYTEDLNMIHLMNFQELAYQKFYWTLFLVVVIYKTKIQQWYWCAKEIGVILPIKRFYDHWKKFSGFKECALNSPRLHYCYQYVWKWF